MPSSHPDPSDHPSMTGSRVHFNFRKWDDAQHWQFDATYLGTDIFGVWVGIPAGSHFERPAAQFDSDCAQVTLITNEGWAPVFHDQHVPHRVRTYVDITTRARWAHAGDAYVVTLIDMDLDVVQRVDEDPFVDDEDEFAQHQAYYGYPASEIARCETDCARVLSMVREHTGPFDGTGERWLQRYLQRREA